MLCWREGKPAIVTAAGSFTDYGDVVVTVPTNITADALAKMIVENAGVDRTAAIENVVKRYSVELFHQRLRNILDLPGPDAEAAH